MPAGSRAYAVSLLAMAGGPGRGRVRDSPCSLADLGPRGWRLLYVIPLLALPVVASTSAATCRRAAGSSPPTPRVPIAGHGGRLLLLAASGAAGQPVRRPQLAVQQPFLRDERGFSGGRIGLFSVVVGHAGRHRHRGRRAHRRRPGPAGRGRGGPGRRARCCTVGFFFSGGGWPMWVWATVGTRPLGRRHPRPRRLRAGAVPDRPAGPGQRPGGGDRRWWAAPSA